MRTSDVVRLAALPAALATWALWLAVGLGELGLSVWIFDLFANFTAQYMALFALCVIALTLARWRKTAIVALLGVAFTTASMAAYFQERAGVAPPDERFRLVTFNLWFRNDDLARAAAFLEASRADVIALQEVEVARIDAIAKFLPAFPHRVATPTSRYALVIFSRWPIRIEELSGTSRLRRKTTRISRVTVDWRGTPVSFFGAHLSWPLGRRMAAARAAELEMLAANAKATPGPVLVAGDFNLTPWSPHFERFVAQSGLTDCAIGQGLLATWPAQLMPARIRIDHCFASKHWRVHRVAVGPDLGSDHLPVTVDLALSSRSGPRSGSNEE